MTARRSARRHKGSHRQISRAATPAPRIDHRDEAIGALCHPHAAEALRFWGAELPNPLFVYFIQATTGEGPVKIGQAQDPIARLRELQCGNWQQLGIRAVVLATLSHERILHSMWAAARVRGEWFGAGYEDVIAAFGETVSLKQVAGRRDGEPIEYVQAIHLTEALAVLKGSTLLIPPE